MCIPGLENAMNVGLLGGSFNPAHKGHLYVSKCAADVFAFDKIIWLVALQNPLKNVNQAEIYEYRFNSAVDVVKDEDIVVSDYERKIESYYTYDTISSLLQEFPKLKFSWIMGSDSAMSFHRWYRYKELSSMLHFVVINRGHSIHEICNVEFGSILTYNDTSKPVLGTWTYLDVHVMNCSSTQIRNNMKQYEG